MAKKDIVMPQMGESITNGTITKWHKAPGDEIQIDEILLEISTDKVESEIPSPFKGRVEEVLFEEGDTIDVGIKIAVIETDLSVAFGGGSSSGSTEAPAASAPAETSAPAAATPEAPAASSGERRFYTPLVRKMAETHGVALSELDSLTGSGAGGRVTKKDFEAYLGNRSGGAATQAAQAPASAPAPAAAPTPAAAPAPTYTEGDRVEVIPMDNMRKAIARNMVQSKLTSPHVNSISEVDLTHLVTFREGFKNEFQKQEGFKLTYTPFIMMAIIRALKEFPLVNASIEGDNIVVKKDINLGCAVAVPGNGLVVPVIKGADNLNMTGLCRAIDSLAKKARAKKLTMDELTGGTFTFTNVGSFGTLLATPVILQPQVGIYAAGVIQKRVMVMKDDAIAVRSMMYGTHTYDHRLVDGELGGKFLEAIHRNLREMDPSSMF
ncbi:MAG: dihydrolipoamide acetyltransferase family protein [Bacteriovoracaceae bacterium]